MYVFNRHWATGVCKTTHHHGLGFPIVRNDARL